MPRRILACGGRQLYHPSLTRYLFGLARRKRPRVVFLPTASGDSPDYLLTFYSQLAGLDCEPSHLLLFNRTTAGPAHVIANADIVMVGGGNTANMLAIWRLHGVEHALRDAYASGTVMTGWSAGCLCWFEGGITDSFTPDLGPLTDGLGILKGTACPHYDGEAARAPTYRRELVAGMTPGIALDDGVAALYEDEHLVEIVSARPEGRAFRCDASGDHPLQVRVV